MAPEKTYTREKSTRGSAIEDDKSRKRCNGRRFWPKHEQTECSNESGETERVDWSDDIAEETIGDSPDSRRQVIGCYEGGTCTGAEADTRGVERGEKGDGQEGVGPDTTGEEEEVKLDVPEKGPAERAQKGVN
jgi:hypothetical protein